MTKSFNSRLSFEKLAQAELGNSQLRSNLSRATSTIREKRLRAIGEISDWEELRTSGAAIKDYVLDHLDELTEKLESNVTRRGGVVHWARTGDEANAIVVDLVKAASATSVVKVKSMVTQEIELNLALERNGIAAYETDLAELIVQLGDDLPSHILVPAIHKNRSEIRDIFLSQMKGTGLAAPASLTEEPAELAAAARAHLRDRFLKATVGISGANFLLADSGGLVIVESEGNGRMCLTLPETLISVVGVEKILPDWRSLGVFLQLLPRSSTGERMNPYTSIFSGVTPGDGPQRFHLVLLDNGRTSALEDPVGREVLRCIRCSACLNVCPVYERTGGHAYGNPYPGPIGAVLVPQLRKGHREALENSLPFASTLCGACFDACPVKIDIPKILVKLRTDIVDEGRVEHPYKSELLGMKAVDTLFTSPRSFRRLVALGNLVSHISGHLRMRHLPPPVNRWTKGRDLPELPKESFRSWFEKTHPNSIGTFEPSEGQYPNDPLIDYGEMTHEVDNARHEILNAMSARRGSSQDGPKSERLLSSRTSDLTSDERIVQMCERLVDYRASVVVSDDQSIGSHINQYLIQRGSERVVTANDLPLSWVSELGASLIVDDPPLTTPQLDKVDAAITGCAVAISESGTIVLDAGAQQGRRILSLVPDHLIIVINEEQIVERVPDGVARLNPLTAQTWISGPSATSDIELERIEGVHGPRVLDVVIVRA
jgi:L-lactate dehydrogenase complex protein LldF